MRGLKLLALGSALALTACGGDDKDSGPSGPQGEGEVTYQLTFTSTWNATDFPTNFPGDPHFSPVIGATHNDQDYLWRTGELSSAGLEQVAETGATSIYQTELAQKKTEGNVDNIFKGGRIESPDTGTVQFKANTSHPLVSAISMIAPSPDWFVGIRDINLYENDEWAEKLTFDLVLYDAGTDAGTQFTSADADNDEVSTRLSSDAADTDFSNGIHRTSGKFVGQFVIERIDNDSAN